MDSQSLHTRLFPQTPSRAQTTFWLSLSLAFAAVYGVMALRQAFAGEYVVQDDARQHVFWMQQFRDAALFQGDLIASYFRSVAPIGYTAVYWLPAQVGLDPLMLNKLLPIGLGLITTAYTFGVSMQMVPVPLAGFLSTLLLNQNIWMKDDLVSATPRGFLYPLFAAFLYYLVQRSLWPCLVTLALQGLFYPQILLLSAGVLVLSLVQLQQGRWGITRDRRDWWFVGLGLLVSFVVLLPFALQTSEYGAVITPAEARQLPEFGNDGRSRFFVPPLEFWLTWERSGIFPAVWKPPLMLAAVLLPVLWPMRDRLPLLHRVTATVSLLFHIIGASLGWFAIAHLVLFKLQLPSRYTQHSLRFVFALAAGIVLAAVLEKVLRLWAEPQTRARWRSPLALGLAGLITLALIAYPSFEDDFPDTEYKEGREAAIYEFFQQQPKDALIASLTATTDDLPTFAQRPVLISREYAIPFHTGYFNQFRQRVFDLIAAQYTPQLPELKAFIRTYGVDFFLVEQTSFRPGYLTGNRWLQQFQPTVDEAIALLKAGQRPALARLRNRCTAFQSEELTVVDANCILTQRLSPLSPQPQG